MPRLSMSEQYKARKAVARECRTTYMTEAIENILQECSHFAHCECRDASKTDSWRRARREFT